MLNVSTGEKMYIVMGEYFSSSAASLSNKLIGTYLVSFPPPPTPLPPPPPMLPPVPSPPPAPPAVPPSPLYPGELIVSNVSELKQALELATNESLALGNGTCNASLFHLNLRIPAGELFHVSDPLLVSCISATISSIEQACIGSIRISYTTRCQHSASDRAMKFLTRCSAGCDDRHLRGGFGNVCLRSWRKGEPQFAQHSFQEQYWWSLCPSLLRLQAFGNVLLVDAGARRVNTKQGCVRQSSVTAVSDTALLMLLMPDVDRNRYLFEGEH
eukprot:2080600-Prymnesium_polylepis.4